MLKPQDFTRTNYGVLKWRWGMPGDNGKLQIDFLDWQQAGTVLSSKTITGRQFENHYMREGLPIPGAPGVPALIRVTEECGQGERNEFVLEMMAAGMRIPIQWRKENSRGNTWKITVYYPNSEIVRPETYPEKMLYFQICAQGEQPVAGARLYLPRPGDNRIHTFWFDSSDGHGVSLRLQDNVSVGSEGRFEASSVFFIKQL